MEDVLQDLLHVVVKKKQTPFLEQLPLFLQAGYETTLFSVGDLDVLFIESKEQITVTALFKQWKRFEMLTGLPCVVYGNECTRYGRERMIELGIPFYFGRDNLYLPFLGMVFGKKKAVYLPEIEKFAPTTQKMLLLALYENWQMVSTKEISENMGISRATAARCLTELQALNLPLTETRGSTKYYQYAGSAKELYEMCKLYFDSPIARSYALAEIPEGLSCYGGLTAIAGYSMLADNNYPTYAVTREEYRKLNIQRYSLQPKTEIPVCIIQVLRYKIEKEGAIDPISAIFCIPEVDKEDPRIQIASEEILEAVYGKKIIGE